MKKLLRYALVIIGLGVTWLGPALLTFFVAITLWQLFILVIVWVVLFAVWLGYITNLERKNWFK